MTPATCIHQGLTAHRHSGSFVDCRPWQRCNYDAEHEVLQFESVAPTVTSDRHCAAARTVPCDAGTYETTALTTTTNRLCSPWATPCQAGDIESAAPTPTSNRICLSIYQQIMQNGSMGNSEDNHGNPNCWHPADGFTYDRCSPVTATHQSWGSKSATCGQQRATQPSQCARMVLHCPPRAMALEIIA